MRISDWSSDVCSSDLQVDHRVLHLLQLGAAILQVVHLVSGLKLDDVLPARRRNVEQHHAATDAGFEVEIFVQLHVRPEIDELDAGVGRADTVATPETLEIGRAHVRPPATNAPLVCRLLLAKKTN